MSAWASASSDLKAVNDRPKTIMLRPRQGTIHADLIEELLVFTPIFFAFGLILMIGCANVTNLLLARGISRQREIGIRLSLGASRAGIIRLLLTESLLLALGSASCALVVSRLALSSGLNAVSTTMPAEVAEQISLSAPAWDWRVIAFLLCGATVSTVLLGLAPALQAARLELVRTMRGEITHDARPGRARNALIAVQVGASALLLICAAVFLRSALAAAAVEPGLRVDDTLALEIGNESARAAVLQEVTGDPTVAAVAAAWPSMLGGTLGVASVSGANTSSRLPIDYKFVSPEYFSLLDIDVVRGRGFAPAERTSGSGVAVVSETVARRLWPDRDAVGQTLHLEPATPRPGEGVVDGPGRAGPAGPLLHARAFAVVGVVRDARVGVGLFQIGDAGLYLPIDRESPETSLTLRVRGDPEHARQRLIERLARLDPAVSIRTLRTLVGIGAYILSIVFWVTAVLGALALALTLSGIFSVLSYVVEQRRQEIGVRMALGATTRSVMGLVLSQSARPVALGLLAGAGLAGTMAIALMSTPAASQIGDTVRVFDPLAYGASLLCIVTACLLAASIPALRAARIDPMATLRQE
jgi:predicted permease